MGAESITTYIAWDEDQSRLIIQAAGGIENHTRRARETLLREAHRTSVSLENVESALAGSTLSDEEREHLLSEIRNRG